MAKRVLIWGGLMIAIIVGLCMILMYMACLGAIQEQRVEKLQYWITSSAPLYWDHFHLPPFSALSRFLFLSHDSPEKDEQAQVHQSSGGDKEKERTKSKLLEAVKESLEAAKLMMEEFANSTAEMAGAVVRKTADMVKMTFSKPPPLPSSQQPHDDDDEL